MRLGAAWCGCVLLVSGHALAEDLDPTAQADALFVRARALVSERRYAEACPLLEQSQRLDPGGGTLLNLASCHEAVGQLATAWAEYQEALRTAQRDARDDRVREARSRLLALATRVSRLRFEVHSGNPTELELRRDDQVIAASDWGIEIAVEPGEHVITARAPQRRQWRQVVTVGETPHLDVVVVPALAELEPEASPLPGVGRAARRAAPERSQPKPARDDAQAGLSTRKVTAIATTGFGVVAIGVGTYFGVDALSKKEQSDAICDREACDPGDERAVVLNDAATRSAWISNVALGTGLVAAGVGLYLWLSAKPARPATALLVEGTATGARLRLMSEF